MKKTILLLILLMLSVLIIGCGPSSEGDPVSEPADALPDSSYSLDMRETHRFKADEDIAYLAMTVDDVLDEPFYSDGFFSIPRLVVKCTLESEFFLGDGGAVTFNAEDFGPGTERLLFISLDGIDHESVDKLRDYLRNTDSLIVYGIHCDFSILSDSEDGRVLSEFFPTGLTLENEGESAVFPGLLVNSINTWSIFPIVDGVADCNEFERVLLDCGISEMTFSFRTDYIKSIGVLDFCDGDDKETVYAAIERFVSESLAGTLPERKPLYPDETF